MHVYPTLSIFLGFKECTEPVHVPQIKKLCKLVLYAISNVPYSKKLDLLLSLFIYLLVNQG